MDIIAISETHLKGDDTIEVDGYTRIGHNRKGTHINAWKGCGGVGVLVKTPLLQVFEMTVFDKTYDGILGLILTSKLTDFKLAMFSCYLSPESRPWGRDATGYFAHLLSQMYLIDDVDSIIVCGVGELYDHIQETDNLPDRAVIDTTVNQHGTALIAFLKESRLCILNGRENSINNDFTCTTARGRSVVDYVLTDHVTLKDCTNFGVSSALEICNKQNLMNYVGTKSRLPDHALLSFHLHTNVQIRDNGNENK